MESQCHELWGSMLFFLASLQPVGLALDIIGFILVFWFGHAVFIRVETTEFPETVAGNKGHLTLTLDSPSAFTQNRRHRRWAYFGAVLVILGFGAQLIASVGDLFL